MQSRSCSSRSRSPRRSSSWANLRSRWPRTQRAYYDPDVSPAPRGPMKMPRPSEDAKAAFAKLVPDEPAVTLSDVRSALRVRQRQHVLRDLRRGADGSATGGRDRGLEEAG